MTCEEVFYRQYLSGDDAGLEALMKKYGDPLTLYIDGYLHDVHEAEDLMLDVFAYLFTKKPKIRNGGFKAYLYKAARHMALRHKSKRKPLFSLDALEKLKAEYREALFLVYFEDMSYRDAATVMNKSESQITKLIYRGKQSLKVILEQEGFTYADK